MRRLATIGLLVALTVPAGAGELRWTYLAPGSVQLMRVLPPPPAAGSAEDREDLRVVEAAVTARTPADEARIVAQLPCTPTAFAGDILGPRFDARHAPQTMALVEHAFEDAELTVLATKAGFDRKRPYVLDPQLKTFGHRSGSTSYPSGHATCGRVMAVILAALVPAKAQALFARATLYGRNRMIAGTHFPSDLAAGATAGSVIAQALFHDARFQADFDRAQVELRAALAEQP